jgi:hypothetical protein
MARLERKTLEGPSNIRAVYAVGMPQRSLSEPAHFFSTMLGLREALWAGTDEALLTSGASNELA